MNDTSKSNDTSKFLVGLGYMSHLLGIQMRNVQAFWTVQQKMLEGLSLVTKQQAEILEVLVRRSLDGTRPTPSPSDLRGFIGARIDELKQSIQETQANSNVLSEIMMRSVGEVASTWQVRMMAALDELKTLTAEAIPEQLPTPLPGPADGMGKKLAAAGRVT